jgi:alkanesulfonate monooxygenase SsuD/methylene tetrahydromethanopterin reductase-like flavin-dependent oxidoreductase (luciferase family)
MLEGYTTMGYLAAVTSRIKVGVLVGGVIYRYPGLLVKAATTLDVLSGGRSYFGIGAGWYEREARGLGVPFPPLSVRYEQLEETLQIAQQMWSGDTTPYDGKHYHLAEPINSPQSSSRPHPPIMIGGEGEKKTLPLVARYADACNFFAGVGVDRLAEVVDGTRHKLALLERYCKEIGRPYSDIERTALGTVKVRPDGMSVDEVLTQCRALADAGIEHIIFNMSSVHELTPLKVFGEKIIPALQAL